MSDTEIDVNDLAIEAVDVNWPTPAERNNKAHTPDTTAKLAKSMDRLGQISPIIVDKEGVIIAGHGRLLAAQHLGWAKIKCITLPVDAETARRMRIADNLASNQSYDEKAILAELQDLGIDDLDTMVADDRMLDNLQIAFNPTEEMSKDAIVDDIDTAVEDYARETDELMDRVDESDVTLKSVFEFGTLKPREARRVNVFLAMLRGEHGGDVKEAFLAHVNEVIENG